MCVHSFSRRQAIRRLVASSLVLAAPTLPVVAQASQITLEGGLLKLKRSTDGKVIYPGERVVVGTGGAVIRSRNQIFYMDDGTEAEFAVDADGRIKKIFVFAGGLLSLFGGENGRGTKIVSANASAAIGGTTTYCSWQNESQRTYDCCCYGHLEVENDKGCNLKLETTYHNAFVLPLGGGVQPAPYERPLDHYDDDIAFLEAHVGRQPRWILPTGKMNFFAPRPAPPLT